MNARARQPRPYRRLPGGPRPRPRRPGGAADRHRGCLAQDPHRAVQDDGDRHPVPTPTSALTPKVLFGKRKRITVRGLDTQVLEGDGYRSETTVSWTAKLKRLKRRTGMESLPERDDVPECADGRDNDRDRATDYPRDSSCTSPTDRSE